MSFRLIYDEDKCVACHACVIACMDQNDTDTARGDTPRRRVETVEYPESGEVVYRSVGCLHCMDAPCVRACPSGCLYKDAETGLTLYHREKCIGCRACESACPNGAAVFGADGLIDKCDGCADRLRSGLESACARVCPMGALQLCL